MYFRHPVSILIFVICLHVLALASFATDRTVKYDFDGDGKTDIAVYREGLFTPTVRTSSYFYYRKSSTGEIIARPFGAGGDRPAVADYDNDGKADLAIFRSWEETLKYPWEASNYWIEYSTTGAIDVIYQLGYGTIVNRNFVEGPRAELGVYNGRFEGEPTEGCYIRGFIFASGPNLYQKDVTDECQIGGIDRIPALGDYDNDGHSDIAVLVRDRSQRRNATWQIWYSPFVSGFTTPDFSRRFDVDFPIPGDYDGDGRSDLAGGSFIRGRLIWTITYSSTGQTGTFAFGLTGDKVVAADYDGDGWTDPAIFRPSDGNWYIYRTSDANWDVFQFGLATDVLITQPNAF